LKANTVGELIMPVIEFLCPNGHRIRCQPDQAGRAAKCPRCGVKFRVPEPNELDVSDAVDADTNVSRPEFTDSGIGVKKTPAPPADNQKEPQIEFLCPNGHRLHGPASLQGRAGECPDCGSRFRIPTFEDAAEEEPAVEEAEAGPTEDVAEPDAMTPEEDVQEVSPTLPPPLKNHTPAIEEVTAPTTVSALVSGRGVAGVAMGDLFIRLWESRPKGTSVELRLCNGETIVPHQFLKQLSAQSRQGVFVVKEANGAMSVLGVAWEAVARIGVRGLHELPKEWGESGGTQ
jgi:hypothetical protein